MRIIFLSVTVWKNKTKTEAALTIENFIELSWWGMDDKVGCYAYLHTKKEDTS